MQLLFNRRLTRRTPGRFRTRVLTKAWCPPCTWSTSILTSSSTTKKAVLCARKPLSTTHATSTSASDFKNLPDLRKIGFTANRRLLDVQRVSHDCSIGEDAFDQVVRSVQVDGQRASALRFGDARVQALFTVLGLFSLQLRGFTNREMRALLAPLLGFDPAQYPVGKMTYDLRALTSARNHRTNSAQHNYRITQEGLRVALFFSRSYTRLLRPKLAEIMPTAPPGTLLLRTAFDQLQRQIDRCCEEQSRRLKLDAFTSESGG